MNAYKMDNCEARAVSGLARLFNITAYYASEKRLIVAAHNIRPEDELVRREWIAILPRQERQAEIAKYLASTAALSDIDRQGFDNEEQYLKARRPGECRISTKHQSAQTPIRIPFKPVYGDQSKVEAYGLDVLFDGKSRRMQIDTGASGITLSPGAAKRLGLTPELKIHAGGVGDEGEVDSYLTHVAHIQIGDVQLDDCTVEVLQESRLGVDGLIGMEVFRHWLVTLDYSDLKLLLNPLPSRPGETTDTRSIQGEDADDESLHDAAFRPVKPSGYQSFESVMSS